MALFHVQTLIPQFASASYNPCKDLFLKLKGQRLDIKDLDARITVLITKLTEMKLEKEKIDLSLRNSVSKEKSVLYPMMETNIKDFHNKCTEFINKYTMSTGSVVSSVIEELNEFKSSMIEEVEKWKRKRLTLKGLKLAKISRGIAKLNEETCVVLDRLKPEQMILEKAEANQEKFSVGDDLPELFQAYVDEVVECLRDNGKTVGIHGSPKVGKTTVMKKLFNQLIEKRSLCDGDKLDYIMWTVYPQKVENKEMIVEKLQKDIMTQLKIESDATESAHMNATNISTFLRDKKYILLMDQVLQEIELDDLGLTEHHENRNVVIASSDKKAIDWMQAHAVHIKRLNEGDAWTLFENACGKITDCRKRAIAERIIKECAGIPLAIKHVAKTLKSKKDEGSWNGVKQILQSEFESLHLGVIGKAYEITYNNLGTKHKKCLLYGALFPSQAKIYRDYLVECWIAEGFMGEYVVQKVRRSRDDGQEILDELTDLDLLEWCSHEEMYIMMPMDFRRVALSLANRGEESGATWVPCDYGDPPHEETWKKVRRMSLIGCNTELPESPKCGNIYTLLLQLKPSLERLAEVFFHHMDKLQVLDLNHTEIRALPTSISQLVNLKSLYLNDCNHLDTLPPAAAFLTKLEFLDICGTSISSLPQEIRYMVDLRCLRASLSVERSNNRSSKGKEVEYLESIIPAGIISNLTKLEELSIGAAFDYHGGIAVAERLANEMANLKYLNTLHFKFPNVSSVDTFVNRSVSLNNTETNWGADTLRSFKIFIGSNETRYPSEPEFSGILAQRWLRYSTNEAFNPACKLLKQASAFEITGHDGVRSLSQFQSLSVKVCKVERCNSFRKVVEVRERKGIVEGSLLQNLEKLYLFDLKLLQCICDGPIPSDTLTYLTTLKLKGCPKLTKILDHALALALQTLRDLEVDNCCNISQIVEVLEEGSSTSEQEGPPDLLRSLRTMKLSNLPELHCICRNSSTLSWTSLNSITISRCRNLKNLSVTCTNAKKLAIIQCEESWWNTYVVFASHELKQRLHPILRWFKEEFPQPGAGPEGEPSSSRRPDFNGASSSTCTYSLWGKERGTESLEDLQASNMDIQMENSRSEDEISFLLPTSSKTSET